MNVNMTSIKQYSKKNYFPLILLTFSLLLFALLFSSVRQKNMNVKVGQLAEETIRAPKTVENTYETAEKRKLAKEAVMPAYVYQPDLKDQQTSRLNQLFILINEVNDKYDSEYQEQMKKAKEGQTIAQPDVEDKVATLKSRFEKIDSETAAFYQTFPAAFYKLVFSLSKEDLQLVSEQSQAIVEKAMEQKIRDTNVGLYKQEAISQIQFLDANPQVQQTLRYVLNQGIIVNEVANDKKTKELQQKAVNDVAPVMIYQGEIIVREGVQVDQKAMEKLELVGLTDQRATLFPTIALIMLIVLQVFMLAFLEIQKSSDGLHLRYLLFYCGLMLISISAMKFLKLFQSDSLIYVPLIFPAAFTPLVLNLFISRRTGIMAAVFQTAFSLMVFYENIGTSSLLLICLFYAFTGLMATLIVRKRLGNQLKNASIWLVLFPMIFVIILMVYQGMSFFETQTLVLLISSIAGCVMTFLLSMGLHPYIELLLNDDSLIVLNELSNPNHPLLKQLLEEAPGTYHHSMMVASLSANAVAEINGRSLLTRVACYYHDIGKIKHANFFVENLPQGAENPHNFLLPEDSKQIIFGHVTDGAKILTDYKMPKMVVDVCEQHHGTTLMKYFYVKAKERDSDVKESDYRYPGPKPQTKEAGVISIADSAEAAVRAMGQTSNEEIVKFVHELILGRIEDGQLDESGLTLGDIAIVEKSLINGLCSSFHSRIKYPKLESEAKKTKAEQDERG